MDENQDLVLDEIIINAKAIPRFSDDDELPDVSSRNRSDTSASFSFKKRRRRMLTPEKRKELEELYQTVIVHDYGDEYHMSEEERKRKFKYYEVFSKLLKCKKKYRKLDEFVNVCRLCIDCINVVAEDNGVYDPDKFKSLVMKGEIEIYGLRFPKYIGKDRKTVNWEYISEYIMDDTLDPKELVKNTVDEDEDEDLSPERLFSESEWNELCNIWNNPKETIVHCPDYEEEDDDRPRIASKKQSKKLIEMQPQILARVKDLKKEERKRLQRHGVMNSFVYDMTVDDFEKIAQIDNERGYYSESDIPVFSGDIMNDDDYTRFIHRLNEYEDNQIKVNYQGKMRTRSEIKEIELKDALEQAGWNVRKLYKQNDKIRNMKKRMKKDKKREDELKKKLMSIQNRQKNRSKGKKGKKDKIEFNAKSKKKKDGG